MKNPDLRNARYALRATKEFFGILNIDKPKGMTSHDVVGIVRKIAKVKKVGHAGTLDPLATGVLVILMGKATKMSSRFLDEDKEYEAVMRLGEKRDTGDAAGNIVSRGEQAVESGKIKETVEEFVGEIDQLPPMYSAKKIKGKKLYELARKGIEIEREPKKVMIYSIEISSIDLPDVRLKIKCGKGTYIRQLADDMGDKLGCGAYLADLRRTKSGNFDIQKSISLDRIREMKGNEIKELARSWAHS